MDEAQKTWMEPMSPGSLHFIPPRIAHRVANVGDAPLHFVACWPSDAGHDYDSIRKQGFGARLLKIGDVAKLVESNP
jgi:glucose-6-phosphate isomerase